MSEDIKFYVPGIPAPGGSKKGYIHPKTKRIIIVEDCQRNKPWRDRVVTFAMDHRPKELLTDAIYLQVDFLMPRPKSHFGTGKNSAILKKSAPKYHTKKPDATKLLRALEDALTGVIWRDDEQVVKQLVRKAYSDHPGALVTISIIE